MDKRTLSNYGWIVVSTMVIAALLSVLSPATPFGYADEIRLAINDAFKEYIDRTPIDEVDNPNTPVDPDPDTPVVDAPDKTVTILFLYESGEEALPKKEIVCEYGSKFDASSYIEDIDGYQPNYIPVEQTITKDVVFTIVYLPNSYKITYVTNGGTITSSYAESYTIGENVVLPTNVIKDGKIFAGWYDNPATEGTRIYELDGDERGDKTFYAKWADTAFSITYISNGVPVTGLTPSEVYPGDGAVALPNQSQMPDQNGYKFLGWYDNVHGQGTAISYTPANPTQDLVYYAKWGVADYNISYETNGGSIKGTYPPSYSTGEEVILPTTVEKPGHTFAGWYDNQQLNGTPVTKIEKGETGNKTFYAKWTPNTYNIAYDANGGTINTTPITQFTYGTVVKYPTSEYMYKEGYIFLGWLDTLTNTISTQTSTTRDSDIYLIAQWEPAKYTITYDANGGTPAITTETKGHNGTYNPPQVSREGYTLIGWFTAKTGGTQITSTTIFKAQQNQTIYAQWKPNEYNIIYITNGGSFSVTPTTKYTYGTGTTTLTTNITKPHSTFGGWYTNESFTTPATSPISGTQTGDITVYAKWTPETYTITYNVQGGTMPASTKYSYSYGDTVILPTPTKNKQIFVGWIDDATGEFTSSINPNDYGNKSYTAQWNPVGISVKINLVDKNGNIITHGGKVLSYTMETVILDKVNTYSANYFATQLGVSGDIYHGTWSFTLTQAEYESLNGTVKEYNIRAYNYRKFTVSTVDTNGYDLGAIFPYSDEVHAIKQLQSNLHASDKTNTALYESAFIGGFNNESADRVYIFAGKIIIDGIEYSASSISAAHAVVDAHIKQNGTISSVKVVYKYNKFPIIVPPEDPVPPTFLPSEYIVGDPVVLPYPVNQCYRFTGWIVTFTATGEPITLETTNYPNDTIPDTIIGEIMVQSTWVRYENSITQPGQSDGHSFEQSVIKHPTCTEAGQYRFTCKYGCGATYDTYPTLPGHIWGQWTDNDSNTSGPGKHQRKCTRNLPAGTVCGAIDGPYDCTYSTTSESSTQANSSQHYRICTVCSGNAYYQNHKIQSTVTKNATCETNGTTLHQCIDASGNPGCAYSYTTSTPPMTGHDYRGVVTKPATCIEAGVMTYTCQNNNCENKVWTETIPILDHVWDTSYTKVSATQHALKCTLPYNCGQYSDYQNHYSSGYTETQTKAPTCVAEGTKRKDCDACEHYEPVPIPKLDHIWATSFTKLNDNSHVKYCDYGCGNYTGAEAHNMQSYVAKEPKCGEDGTRTYYCTKCSHTYNVGIPAPEHEPEWVGRDEPTCMKEGADHYRCSLCSTTLPDVSIAKKPHNWSSGYTKVDNSQHAKYCLYSCGTYNDYRNHYQNHTTGNYDAYTNTTTTAATCTAAGAYDKDCNYCSYTEQHSIPALEHSNSNAWTDYGNDTQHRSKCVRYGSGGCTKYFYENHKNNVSTTDSTCYSKGIKITTCTTTGCGHTTTQEIDKKPHSYGQWYSTGDNTHRRDCANIAYCTAYETGTHNWVWVSASGQATCLQTLDNTYKCSDCSATKIVHESGDHSYGSWTKYGNMDTHRRQCSICSGWDYANHVWTLTSETESTSCSNAGAKNYKCNTCGETKKTDKDPLAHDYTGTCQQISGNATNHYRYCKYSGCSAKAYEQHSAWGWNNHSTPATNCYTASQSWQTCKGCSYQTAVTSGSALPHQYSDTYYDQGNNATHAKRCIWYNGVNCTQTSGSEAHNATLPYNSEVTSNATCYAAGTTKLSCQRCTYKTTGTIAQRTHSMSTYTPHPTQSATYCYSYCTRTNPSCGYTNAPQHTFPLTPSSTSGSNTCAGTLTEYYVCSRCNYTKEETSVGTHNWSTSYAKKDNNYHDKYCTRTNCGVWKNDPQAHSCEEINRQAATCVQNGYIQYKCTACTYSYQTTLYAAGHPATKLVGQKTATCMQAGYTGDYVCTTCSQTVTTGSVIPKLDHIASSSWKSKDASHHVKYCTYNCGTAVETQAHDKAGWTTVQNKGANCKTKGDSVSTCNACGYANPPVANGGLYGDHPSTRTYQQKNATHHILACSLCTANMGEETHDTTGWTTSGTASCGQTVTKTCKGCNYQKTETSSHSWTPYSRNNSTCIYDAYYVQICSICSAVNTQTMSYTLASTHQDASNSAPQCDSVHNSGHSSINWLSDHPCLVQSGSSYYGTVCVRHMGCGYCSAGHTWAGKHCLYHGSGAERGCSGTGNGNTRSCLTNSAQNRGEFDCHNGSLTANNCTCSNCQVVKSGRNSDTVATYASCNPYRKYYSPSNA